MNILTPPVEPVRARSLAIRWQAELREAIRDPQELCRRLDLPVELVVGAADGAGQFPVFVPPAYLARIKPGDASDPLLKQVLPLAAEATQQPGFISDPVDDAAAEQAPGLLQKYQGRALLITTGVCAVHCRYCFRRHYPYDDAPHSDAAWGAALEKIADDGTLHEVILSGGDPWMLADGRLQSLVEQIEAIEHVKRLRVHTRLPIMVPSRVTAELLDNLANSRLTTVVVLHANHAQELDEIVAQACERLRSTGAVLLNQAVLLRGVNDSADAQCGLSERLIELGVAPYYLHQLDRVAGASHFEVSEKIGREIVAEMRKRLPGYLVPRYVKEVAGEVSKTVLL